MRYVRALDPCSFKPNGHEDLIVRAKARAKNFAPGQNNQKAKWAKGVIEVMKSDRDSGRDTEGAIGTSVPTVTEILSDDDEDTKTGIDENKIISVKFKKEDIPKCWIEVYLQMPKTSPSKILKSKQGGKQNAKSKRGDKNNTENTENTEKSFEDRREAKSSSSMSSTCSTNDNELCIIEADDVACEGRYVQLDLFNGGSKVGSMIDSPKSFEAAVRARRPLSYVIAVDATGIVVDVTSRYSSSIVNTKKVRMQCIEWWEQLVNDSTARERDNREGSNRRHSYTLHQSMGVSSTSEWDCIENTSISNNTNNNRKSSIQSNLSRNDVEYSDEILISKDNDRQSDRAARRLAERLRAEQCEFQSQALKEPMPKTLSGFKNHPLYILERDIKVIHRQLVL